MNIGEIIGTWLSRAQSMESYAAKKMRSDYISGNTAREKAAIYRVCAKELAHADLISVEDMEVIRKALWGIVEDEPDRNDGPELDFFGNRGNQCTLNKTT